MKIVVSVTSIIEPKTIILIAEDAALSNEIKELVEPHWGCNG
jgi:hypothetical protein